MPERIASYPDANGIELQVGDRVASTAAYLEAGVLGTVVGRRRAGVIEVQYDGETGKPWRCGSQFWVKVVNENSIVSDSAQSGEHEDGP